MKKHDLIRKLKTYIKKIQEKKDADEVADLILEVDLDDAEKRDIKTLWHNAIDRIGQRGTYLLVEGKLFIA